MPEFQRKEKRVGLHSAVFGKLALQANGLWLAPTGNPVPTAKVRLGNRTKLCVTRGSRQAAEVLQALRLSDLDPPGPPEGKKTVM